MKTLRLSTLLLAILAANGVQSGQNTHKPDPAPIKPAAIMPAAPSVSATPDTTNASDRKQPRQTCGSRAVDSADSAHARSDHGSASGPDPIFESPRPIKRHKRPKDEIQHDFFSDAPTASGTTPIFIHASNKPLDQVLAEIYPEYRIEIRNPAIKDREVSITGRARSDILYEELMQQMPDIKGWRYKEECLLIVDYSPEAGQK